MSGFPTTTSSSDEVAPEDLAAVLFNEQRALEGPRIDDGYLWMAHAALNRIYKLKKPLGHRTAPTKLGRVWPNERTALQRARKAAYQAIEERKHGKDPTGGALYWQHISIDPRWSPEFARDYLRSQKYQGNPLKGLFGPFENRNHSKKQQVIPGEPVYLGIYGK